MKLLISLLVVIAPTVFTAPPTRHHIHKHHHYSSSPSTISFKSFHSSRRSPPSSTSSLHFPPTSSSSNRPRDVSSSTGYASYETTLKLGPNEFLIPSSPQRPSLYDQDPASLVPGLIITRLAEDFARLTAQGLRSKETRIPVYVAVSEEDDDGLPTAKSIPKLVHLLDATSQRSKDTAQYEEVQPLGIGGLGAGIDPQSYRDKAPIETGIPVIEVNSDNPASNPNIYQTPTISNKRPSTSPSVPSSPSSSNDDPTIAVAVATPVATSAESSISSTSPSQKEPIDAAKAELEVISKIHHLIEKQQETLFKQHVESVIKDHLVNLVKQHVNQALAQASVGRGHQETSNRPTYVDHITASANNQRHPAPPAQSGKISVGEKANLNQQNAMYRPAESAESVDKVTVQMIHQIKGQLDQLNSQLNQTVAALPESAATPAPHKTPASPSTIQLTPEVIREAVIAAAKEAERRMWAEEQVRRMTEHLAEGDLHAVEQRNLIHNIMHHLRRPRDIDDRMEAHAHEEEETSLPDPSEQYEYHREESSSNVPETISIPVVLLPQRETDDAISHDMYHHEGDADAGHQQEEQKKK